MKLSRSIYSTPVALLSAAALMSTNAFAEDNTLALEEVVVTAQKRATDLQTTAAAISAYSSEALLNRGISDIEDLGRANPSMDVSLYQGEAQIYIRGIGYSGIIGGTDSSSALHLDGVYVSRSSSAVPGFMDIDRVEVVRGPQGTLYGRNATSGSINLIHKRPTEEFSAKSKLSLGNYEHYKAFGAISGALSDNLRARLAMQLENHEGYTDLTRLDGSSHEAEAKDDFTARFTLEYDLSDSVLISLSGDYYEADDTQVVWHRMNAGAQTNPFFQQYIANLGGVLSENYSRDLFSDLEHENNPRIWGLTGRVEWDLGDYQLTSITAYRETNPFNHDEGDFTAAFGVDQLREEDHKQFSQEFQLSSPQDRALSWLVGFYYFTEENDVRNEYFLPFVDEQYGLPNDDNCCLLELNGTGETDAWAIFGEATWDITDNLELLVGGRYSEEERGGRNDVLLRNFIPGVLDNVAGFNDETFDSFTPKVGLNYTLNEDLFIYASISEGFKSGGFNVGSYQQTPFEPEEILAYEIGIKADLFDNRLRLNSALFFYDYDDLQIQDVENNNTVVRNAAKAEIFGLELEGTALITENFLVDFGFVWLNAEFTEGALMDPKAPALGIQELDGNNLPRAPEFKAVLGAQYEIALSSGSSLQFRVDYSWQDEVFFSAFNVGQLSEDAYDWTKAKVTYSSADRNWSLAAYVDNISDEEVFTNATYWGDIVDSVAAGSLAPPRTYGVELNYNF